MYMFLAISLPVHSILLLFSDRPSHRDLLIQAMHQNSVFRFSMLFGKWILTFHHRPCKCLQASEFLLLFRRNRIHFVPPAQEEYSLRSIRLCNFHFPNRSSFLCLNALFLLGFTPARYIISKIPDTISVGILCVINKCTMSLLADTCIWKSFICTPDTTSCLGKSTTNCSFLKHDPKL